MDGPVFSGIDWASEEHAACVVDQSGRIVEGRRYRHDERGLRALCNRLVELHVQLVAVERPDGLLIERLLDSGLHVIAVHPNKLAAMRPRFSTAGAKSDDLDAFMLAELARTDSHRFQILVPDSDQTKALRGLTRAREDLVSARVAMANQLRAQLDCFWPGAARVFADIDSPISLAFLDRYPSPADTDGLGVGRMGQFLKRQRYSGGRDAADMLNTLRQAATGRAGEHEILARREIVKGLVAALKPLVAQIARLTDQIRQALAEHPDGRIFQSLFLSPRTAICPATILAEMGDCRARYAGYRELAADGGQAPVAKESGKRRNAQFRWACDHRLRNAIAVMADTSRRHNPWAADIYDRARQRGATHQHALRILGRAWCSVLWSLWQNHQIYDPLKHTAHQRLLTSTTARG